VEETIYLKKVFTRSAGGRPKASSVRANKVNGPEVTTIPTRLERRITRPRAVSAGSSAIKLVSGSKQSLVLAFEACRNTLFARISTAHGVIESGEHGHSHRSALDRRSAGGQFLRW
jgi:hypothetical protein